MKYRSPVLAYLMCFGCGMIGAKAQLVIDPTFESSITSNANAAAIESGINQAIAVLEGDIATPITVTIDFTNENTGLANTSAYEGEATYSLYHSRLATHATSANDALALATLPFQASNPVNGNTFMEITYPLARALGIAASPPAGQYDGTISLNLSRMNLSRTGPQNSSDFDLQSLVTHEMDEVLGIGGYGSELNFALSGNNNVTTGIPAGPMDLFRYSAPGVRSFTTSGAAVSYFSIDGGITELTGLNQGGSGSDYGDWATSSMPQVQDAFATADVDINLGANELTALDVVGYRLTATPEPSTYAIVGLGLAGLVVLGRRRLA